MDILDLQPPTIEWRVYRMDSTVLTVLLQDSAGNAIDLTDWEFEAKVREFPTDGEAVTAMEVVKNGNTLTLGLDTTNLPVVSYFDVQGTNSVNEKISTVLRGQIFVEEDVTR
jgi:hypothetical protein